MWFSKKRTAPQPTTEPVPGCTATLVVHADGTLECEAHEHCGTEELLHDLWVTCDELRCGCVGEEHDLDLALPLAA